MSRHQSSSPDNVSHFNVDRKESSTTKRIEVFVRSYPIARDIEEYRHAGAHTYCAPGMSDGLRGLAGFKGRIFDEHSAQLWSDVLEVRQRVGERVRIHDVERITGRLHAIKSFVWKAPAVVIDGERHLGMPAACEALRRILHMDAR
jgi:hypothetical protein